MEVAPPVLVAVCSGITGGHNLYNDDDDDGEEMVARCLGITGGHNLYN